MYDSAIVACSHVCLLVRLIHDFPILLFCKNLHFFDRFIGAIKQYLCLSLLKNSASTLMIVFQLSCSIFISLVSRFRAGLKAEIGVFFPMIVLRVLENVAQPNFQQKMIVLRFLDKLCVDSQILVDIFINYDCDVHSSNIFERYNNFICVMWKCYTTIYSYKFYH